jgi:hypothetical protein
MYPMTGANPLLLQPLPHLEKAREVSRRGIHVGGISVSMAGPFDHGYTTQERDERLSPAAAPHAA